MGGRGSSSGISAKGGGAGGASSSIGVNNAARSVDGWTENSARNSASFKVGEYTQTVILAKQSFTNTLTGESMAPTWQLKLSDGVTGETYDRDVFSSFSAAKRGAKSLIKSYEGATTDMNGIVKKRR